MRQETCPDKFIHISRMAHQVEIRHRFRNLLSGLQSLAAQQDGLCTGDGGISNEMNFFAGHIRQHSDSHSLSNVQEIAKTAGQINRVQVLQLCLGRFHKYPNGGKDTCLGAQKIVNVRLSDYYFLVIVIRRRQLELPALLAFR
jgi:hypothetical protein